MKNQSFRSKVANALAGLRVAWSAEHNFRTEVVLGVVTLGLFAVVQPAAAWWALIVLCITLVLAAEQVNSAFEALADLLHPERHPMVGKVKDMLAGMVLIVTLGVAAVAVLALVATLWR